MNTKLSYAERAAISGLLPAWKDIARGIPEQMPPKSGSTQNGNLNYGIKRMLTENTKL